MVNPKKIILKLYFNNLQKKLNDGKGIKQKVLDKDGRVKLF